MDQSLQAKLHMRRERAGDGVPFEVDVELEVPPGITILFGPSGSGKSTILQCIAGLVRPERGRITLGDEIWFDSEARIDRPVHTRRVAYLFQSLALFPHMTAVGNVMYGIDRNSGRAERAERASALLERLGVGHLAARRPRTFSGGEAQRVALARALAMNPHLLLLDEPFSALDRDLRGQLAAEVRRLVDDLKIPTIQVTHHHGEARSMGDRLVRVAAGRVLDQGPIGDLLEKTLEETPLPIPKPD